MAKKGRIKRGFPQISCENSIKAALTVEERGQGEKPDNDNCTCGTQSVGRRMFLLDCICPCRGTAPTECPVHPNVQRKKGKREQRENVQRKKGKREQKENCKKEQEKKANRNLENETKQKESLLQNVTVSYRLCKKETPDQAKAVQFPVASSAEGKISADSLRNEKSVPAQVTDETVPPQATKKSGPTQVTEENVPPQATEENVPPKATEENVPTQVTKEHVTPQATEENVPTQFTEENVPTQVTEENFPPQITEENVPTHVTEENVPPQATEEPVPPEATKESAKYEKGGLKKSAVPQVQEKQSGADNSNSYWWSQIDEPKEYIFNAESFEIPGIPRRDTDRGSYEDWVKLKSILLAGLAMGDYQEVELPNRQRKRTRHIPRLY